MDYPTLNDAVAEFPTFLDLLRGKLPSVPVAVKSTWIIIGFGCSKLSPVPAVGPEATAHAMAKAKPVKLTAHQKKKFIEHAEAMQMDPNKIDWGKWLPIAIQIFMGLLGGFAGK